VPIRKEQFFPGALYHIYNRGNAKGEIFYTDKDRYRFLQGLYISNNSNSNFGLTHLEGNSSGCTLLEIKEIFDKSKISYDPLIKIYIDCLMPNHFHLFAEEVKEGGIVRFMQRSGVSYGRYFTIKNDRPGSLFQGRFKAVPIETDDQLKYLLAYINVINPAQLIEPNLKEKGISASVHFDPPVHLQPYYEKLRYGGKLPITEKLSQSIVTLPMFPGLSKELIQVFFPVSIGVFPTQSGSGTSSLKTSRT